MPDAGLVLMADGQPPAAPPAPEGAPQEPPRLKVDTKVDVAAREVTYTIIEGLALPRTFKLPFCMIKRTAALIMVEEVKHETGGAIK